MNKNKLPIQFTKLTRGDMAMHKYCYTRLLYYEQIGDETITTRERGEELCKALQLFYEAFK